MVGEKPFCFDSDNSDKARLSTLDIATVERS